ncbi:MAG: hypothetical protein U9R44_01975 [Candidatus Omnitrophota bacterium]|nr:hypothetical protein [Candidatus Omnitrophota bacterium]
MKKKLLLILVLILFVGIGQLSHGRGRVRFSSDMDLEFNNSTKLLSVHIHHRVNNPRRNYIAHVTVILNKVQKIEQYLSRQDDNTGLSLSYKLPGAKAGDVIKVTAKTNRNLLFRKKLRVQ